MNQRVEERIKISAELPKSLWKRVRIQAIEEDRDLREVLADALETYLREASKKGGKGGAR